MDLTTQAKILWDNIPKEAQLKLLNNVYCVKCKTMVGIGEVKGEVEKGNLILKGICTTCAGPVARLIEGT